MDEHDEHDERDEHDEHDEHDERDEHEHDSMDDEDGAGMEPMDPGEDDGADAPALDITSVTGSWDGDIAAFGLLIPVNLELILEDGALVGLIDVPAQGITDARIDAISYADGVIGISDEATGFMLNAVFDGVQIEGTVLYNGIELGITLVRGE